MKTTTSLRMKYLCIFHLLCCNFIFAQDDFFDIYKQVKESRVNEKEIKAKTINVIKEMPYELRSDTGYVRSILRHSRDTINALRVMQLQKVLNLAFPDINFIDQNNRRYTLSEFKGTEIAVCFKYMYCDPCFEIVDTTLHFLRQKNAMVIALFSDKFQKEATNAKAYKENVLVGFINDETQDLISLTMGDSFAYYLNQERKILFFDRIYLEKNESAWINFLDN